MPGNSLRIVQIENIDTEACCGTHVDNTNEVGLIRILKTTRISDGIVRLYYVASNKALEKLNNESDILYQLTKSWDVDQSQIIKTANKFFSG